MHFDELLQLGYTPYSERKAAAVIEGDDGRFYPGVRIENLSYPLTITHIQSALFYCLSEKVKPVKLILPRPAEPGDLLDYWVKQFKLSVEFNHQQTFRFQNPVKPVAGDQIADRLRDLCRYAVVPNSGFPVSCLLETRDGFISGVNVEVSNWELGLCAERVAISKAITAGYREFKSIYVMAPKSDYVSPCGACRQVLVEHLPQKRVYLYQNESDFMSVTTSQLLPYHFRGDSLKKNP